MDFSSLCEEAASAYGQTFRDNYEKKVASLSQNMREGTMNLIESNFALVEFVFDYIEDLSPRVVYGLIPPYYPNVSNLYFEQLDGSVKKLADELDDYVWKNYQQHYTKEYFYTGISDLSYTSVRDGAQTLKALETFMPLLGAFYSIPVTEIEKISMPCMNIGPWGKDFHKLTERVCKEDLFQRTPRIINQAVSLLLNDPSLAQVGGHSQKGEFI